MYKLRVNCLLLIVLSIVFVGNSTIFPSKQISWPNIQFNLPRVPQVPVASNPRISLTGTYTLEAQGIIPVNVIVDESKIIIQGCNTLTFNYEAFLNGTFRVSSSVLSTKRLCQNDRDNDYVRLFRQATTLRKSG